MTDDLMRDYHGDEPYPDTDHALGEHYESDPDPRCRACRAWRVRPEVPTPQEIDD